MATLTTYADSIAHVEALGFMALSEILPGMPLLGGETAQEQWYTGLDTDLWIWEDRAEYRSRWL